MQYSIYFNNVDEDSFTFFYDGEIGDAEVDLETFEPTFNNFTFILPNSDFFQVMRETKTVGITEDITSDITSSTVNITIGTGET